MKAKIKATGEIVEVHREQGQKRLFICKHSDGNVDSIDIADFTFIDDSIDWEQRRYELAREAMSRIIPIQDEFELSNYDIAIAAVSIADEVIKRLKQ